MLDPKDRLTWKDPAYMKIIDWFYIFGAREDDPSGTYCGNCGKLNLLADDIGFSYLTLPYLPEYNIFTLMNPINTGYLAVCADCLQKSGHPPGDR